MRLYHFMLLNHKFQRSHSIRELIQIQSCNYPLNEEQKVLQQQSVCLRVRSILYPLSTEISTRVQAQKFLW